MEKPKNNTTILMNYKEASKALTIYEKQPTFQTVKPEKVPTKNDICGFKIEQTDCGAKIAYKIRKKTTSAKERVIIGFNGGASFGGIGLAHLTEHMLLKKSSFKLESMRNTLKDKEISIGAYTSMRNLFINVSCKNEDLDFCIKLVSDLITNNDFDEKVFEKEKQIIVNEILLTMDDLAKKSIYDQYIDNMMKAKDANKEILGEPYDLSKYTLQDVINYKNKYLNLDNLVIVTETQNNYGATFYSYNKHLFSNLKRAESENEIAKSGYITPIKDSNPTYHILRTKGGSADVVVLLKNKERDSVSYIVSDLVQSYFYKSNYGLNRLRLRDEEGLCYSRINKANYDDRNAIIGAGARCSKANIWKVIIMQLNLFRQSMLFGLDMEEFISFKQSFFNTCSSGHNNYYAEFNADAVFGSICKGESFLSNEKQQQAYDFITTASLEEFNALLKKFYLNSILQVLVEGDVKTSDLPSPKMLDGIFKNKTTDIAVEKVSDLDADEQRREIKYYDSAYNLNTEFSK